MKIAKLLVLLLFASTAQATQTLSLEAYSKVPLSIDCVIEAVQKAKGIKNIKVSVVSVEFFGDGFSGAIFHGGAKSPFKNYGVEVTADFGHGGNEMDIANNVTNSINTNCGK